MSLNQEERFIREKLNQQEIPVDTDALWSAVRPKQKKDSRRLLIWFFGFGILAIAGIFTYQNWKVDSSMPISQNSTDQKMDQDLAPVNKAKEIDLAQTSNEGPVKTGDKTPIEFKERKEENNLKANQNKINQTEINTSINNSGIVNKHSNTLKSTSFGNEPIEQVAKIDHPKDASLVQNGTESSNYRNAHFPKIDPVSTGQRVLSEPALLASLNLLIPFEMDSELTEPIPPSIQVQRSKDWKLGLDLALGTGIIFQQLSSARPELNSYVNSIEMFEKPLDYYHGQLALKWKHRSGMYIKTGLSYSRITSRISLSNVTIKDTIIQGIQYYDIDPMGARSQVEGDVMALYVEDYQAKWHSYHHIIDLPIILGYEVINTKAIGLSIEGGLRTNLATISKGAIINQEGFLDKFKSSDSNNVYRKNLGFNWQMGVDLRFLISNRNTLSLRANWTQFGRMTNRQSEFNKQYQVLGINLGIQRQF